MDWPNAFLGSPALMHAPSKETHAHDRDEWQTRLEIALCQHHAFRSGKSLDVHELRHVTEMLFAHVGSSHHSHSWSQAFTGPGGAWLPDLAETLVRVSALERNVRGLNERIEAIATTNVAAKRMGELQTLRSYLDVHIKERLGVEQVYVKAQEVTGPVEVYFVIPGPGTTENALYEALESCLFTFGALELDFVVLYERNLPQAKDSLSQAKRI